ncbi:hypothetical protein KAV67_03750 [Candidatus Bipolaricaulota bacterium]|nr:hypothetical protein [Candidatus Bipolaricaulota bacterium]
MLLLVAGVALIGVAATTCDQTVSCEVAAIQVISVSGNPAALVINSATAGFEPDSATDATTTYSITVNRASKITAKIDTVMSTDITLTINLASTGGTSAGDVDISNATTIPLDVVTSILAGSKDSNETITYTLSALASAGVVSHRNKTVTLTITDTL